MDFFFIFVVAMIVISVIASANKKKKAEEAKRRAAQQAAVRKRPPVPDDRFPEPDELKPRIKPAPPAYQGSMAYTSSEGSAEGSSEGTSLPGNAYSTAPVQATVLRHVVKPMTESSHRHTESSATGFTECPEDAPDVSAAADRAYDIVGDTGFSHHLTFDRSGIVEGILYAEILGKPKALRPRG